MARERIGEEVRKVGVILAHNRPGPAIIGETI